MSQVIDHEKLVCGGSEEQASSLQEELHVSTSPPASFLLPIKDGIDWIDFSASFLDRDDSTKEITNPKSVARQTVAGNLGGSPRKNTSSQKFSGMRKAPIIALPNKLRHSGYLGHSKRQAPIFPKKGHKEADVTEPTSPKVSCFGRVLSERDRMSCRRRKTYATSHDTRPAPKRSRFCFAICKLFRFGKKHSRAIDDDGKLPS